jgi:putative FmdB family regulatory protein
MPVFEYKCKSCGIKYEIYHPVKENKEDVACPECKSSDSEKLFSTFSASITSTSNQGAPMPAACQSCCHGPSCGHN